MKATTTITLDVDIMVEAKAKTGNLSGTINDMLKAWCSLPENEIPNDVDELKKLLAVKSAEIEGFKKDLGKLEKKEQQDPKSTFI